MKLSNARTHLGQLALLTAALIWGTSFIIMKDAVDAIPIYLLLAIRFTIAAILLGIIFLKRMRKLTLRMLGHGAVIGVLLFAAYVTQTIGLTGTTPGKNAFLTAVYCVLVPFLMWMLFGKRPTGWNWAAAVLCMTGIGLVSLDGDLTMGVGDAWTLLGGVFFSAHMVAVSRFGEKEDPVALTVCQFAVAAACSWLTSLAVEGAPAPIPSDAWFELLYLSFFASAAAMLLQNVGQSMTPATSASILLSFESVFGVFFSVLLGRETLTLQVTAGFIAIFIAVIASETQFSFLRRKDRIA